MQHSTARAKFRQLLSGPRFILALGVWDPLTSRVAEAMGIECLSLAGYQMGVGTVISEPLMTLT